jgi:hypothetical protein
MSGSPPGDLARILSRVLDAMRQFGSVPFTPIRRQDFEKQSHAEKVSRGLDQELRRLCREATRAINRYPLKDPLSFTATEEDDLDEDEVEDNDLSEFGSERDLRVDNYNDETVESSNAEFEPTLTVNE